MHKDTIEGIAKLMSFYGLGPLAHKFVNAGPAERMRILSDFHTFHLSPRMLSDIGNKLHEGR